jgi:hypothetical protein
MGYFLHRYLLSLRLRCIAFKNINPCIASRQYVLQNICKLIRQVFMSECIEWSFGLNSHGYGQVWVGGRLRGVHRLVYFICHGYYPPVVRHTCDNPACYNPEHLIGGTHMENSQDMVNRGRHHEQVKLKLREESAMVEISEKERARRRKAKMTDKSTPAQSFRFGKDVRDKLVRISRRRDRSQADVMRDLIDREHERLFS